MREPRNEREKEILQMTDDQLIAVMEESIGYQLPLCDNLESQLEMAEAFGDELEKHTDNSGAVVTPPDEGRFAAYVLAENTRQALNERDDFDAAIAGLPSSEQQTL